MNHGLNLEMRKYQKILIKHLNMDNSLIIDFRDIHIISIKI